ncbi:MAG: ASCH domain-containing protein [Halobacteriovoraceae bacterium]|nr:ASCH domain-containing protein [Halobacteriovoraceae bacterium]
MSIQITEKIQTFWNSFVETDSKYDHLKNYKFEAWSFGNTTEMADELGALVVEGKKTATCSLLRAYRGEESEIPQVGLYSLICDGSENPLCVVFLTHTWICPYDEVDEVQAFEEGEGDRSLEYWRKAHLEFFSQYEGFHEKEDLICERFKVVYKES